MEHKDFEEYCDKSSLLFEAGRKDGQKRGFLFGIILGTVLSNIAFFITYLLLK